MAVNIPLILSWWRSLSYRNQSIELQSKSVDCFLYDWDLRHEGVNEGLMYFKDGSNKCSNNVTKALSNVVKKKEKDFIAKTEERILVHIRGFDHYFAFSDGKVANIINDSSH